MRLHAAHTEAILSRIGAFTELARVAGAHHERLDGGGYPRGLKADQISLETRIITTADIFDAISADRPYRGAVPVAETLRMMARASARRSIRSASKRFGRSSTATPRGASSLPRTARRGPGSGPSAVAWRST